MTEQRDNRVYKFLSGGITWPCTILCAVICGVLTGIVMNLEKVFGKTSINNIGVCFEFWIFVAVLIMYRCKSAKESAMKVFIFFLISQPLVYLVQIPFKSMGWDLFQYYKPWAIWTVLTLPGALIGWYINKRNWFSVAIYFIAVLLLSYEFGNHLSHFLKFPPYHILTLVFIVGQIVLYSLTFNEKSKKLTLAGLSLISIVGLSLFSIQGGYIPALW